MIRYYVQCPLQAITYNWATSERNRLWPTAVAGRLTKPLVPLEITITAHVYTAIADFNDYPYVEVELWGGGGAGGWVPALESGLPRSGGGGGGGAYGRWILPRSFWSDRLYALAGTGGFATTTSSESGNGSTVLNALVPGAGYVFVFGGSSGQGDTGNSWPTGDGGSGGSSYVVIAAPEPEQFVAGANGAQGQRTPLVGGVGGDAGFRVGTGGIGGENAIGYDGSIPGGGGGGASKIGSGPGYRGGHGAPGKVILRWPRVFS